MSDDRLTETDWVNFSVRVQDQVAHIDIVGATSETRGGRMADPHWELVQILNELRLDNRVRVVVIAGEHDGEFQIPTVVTGESDDPSQHMRQDAARLWKASTAIVRMHEAMAELDRPIVAKVNGDAIGLGSSIMFSADLIYARDDARVVDNHLGMGEVAPYRSLFGVVPGDGGTALLPLFMSPVKAKEYLMLAKEYTGAELAQLGAINAALPLAELDDYVDDVVSALLRRSAYALAWTKRVANKHVVEQLHRTLDAGIAYELVNMYQIVTEGRDMLTLE